MSVENISKEEKKEIKTNMQEINAAVLDSNISDEEAKQLDDAIRFVKTNESEKSRINEDIDKQKTTIKQALLQQFTKTSTENSIVKTLIKTEEIQKITTPEVAQAYINIIDRIGGDELQKLRSGLTNQLNVINVQAQKTAETAEDQKAIDIINSTTNPNILFETGSEQDFITVMKYLCGNNTTKKITSNAEGDKYEQKLLELINNYKQKDQPNITEISIGQAKKATFAEQYKEGTWIIEYEQDREKKHISRGTNDHLEELKAEQAATDEKFDTNVFDVNQKGIEYFNKDVGYFAGFQKFLEIQESKNPGYVVQYLPRIMEEINEVQPGKEINPTFIKNGYANVLSDYIIDNISNTELLSVYLTNLDIKNLNLLGGDQATQTKNYNRLFFENPAQKTLRPQINERLQTMNSTDKKAFVDKIAAIKFNIDGKQKTSTIEGAKKTIDNLIETFGPMLLSILSSFGIGKATLNSRFPGSEQKINELFLKEYGLDEDQKTKMENINKLVEKQDTKVQDRQDYEAGIFPTAKTIKKTFNFETQIRYVEELQKNITSIAPGVLKNCVDIYNKNPETKEKITLGNLVEMDSENKKIVGLRTGQEKTFNTIITEYLTNDSIRTTIAASNKNIGSKVQINKIPQQYNESGINIQNARQQYCITTNADTARFLTASFFSDKNLESVITTNELYNNKSIEKQKGGNDNNPSKIKMKEKKYYAENGITEEGTDKTINEIIDTDSSPEKMQIISGDTTTIINKKILADGSIIYISEKDTDKTPLTADDNIKLKKGDKIEEIKSS